MRAKITNNLLKNLKATGKGYDVNDPDLPGFALRVSAEGKPTSYSVRYRMPDGRRQRLKVGSANVLTPRQARDLALDALADATKGDDPQDLKKHLRGVKTLGRFVEEEYVPHVLAYLKSGAETLKRLKSCFGQFWNRPLTDHTWHSTILTWRADRIESGKTKGTANRDVASLRAVFSHAVRVEVLDLNPLRRLRQIKVPSISVIRYLSEDEHQRLMRALDDREERFKGGRERANTWREKYQYKTLPDLRAGRYADHLKPMVLLALHTGLRRGEVFDLEWSDFDLDRAVLTVRAEVAKNSKSRHVPLNKIALDVVKAWKGQTSGEGLVFRSPRTGGRFNNVNAVWHNLMMAAEIPKFRWHDMRHDFASKLVMAGVDLNTVRELLGHGDIKHTLRYAHLAPEHKARAVEMLAKGRTHE